MFGGCSVAMQRFATMNTTRATIDRLAVFRIRCEGTVFRSELAMLDNTCFEDIEIE